MASKIVFSVVVLLALVQLGLCLQCYKCSTEEHGDACLHPTDDTNVEECSENQVCASHFVVDTTEKTQSYDRGCAGPTDCLKSRAVLIGCITCPGDKCNTHTIPV
ncbi:hypothetical protein ILUMI_19253 [Ignelater luminosus]|uniref:Protein sleepless n=1 Tax=Ignelater luminosus TaxID=2038154 RepID=A0A8K0G036_IGNLU|nr:hypothetical protein ILUMI_19253 [Ignelater luminosus]